MMDFSNKWKLVSVCLMVILAIGFAAPKAFAPATNSIEAIVTNIQNNLLPGINTHITSAQTAINTNTNTAVSGAQTAINAHTDTAVSSRATQTSVNALQTSVNGIPAQTYGSQINSTNVTFLVNGTGASSVYTAVSDHPYNACFVFTNIDTTSHTLFDSFQIPAHDTISGCIGEPAGKSLSFFSEDAPSGLVSGVITIITSANAISSITTSYADLG